jgi:hypothetical protein
MGFSKFIPGALGGVGLEDSAKATHRTGRAVSRGILRT